MDTEKIQLPSLIEGLHPKEVTTFAALIYLQCGFTVQPLKLGTKELISPYTNYLSPEYLKQELDPFSILAGNFYNRNICLRMGDRWGHFMALDFDNPDVYHAWAVVNPHIANKTATAKTPSGGYHVVVKHKLSTPYNGKSDHYVDVISDDWYIAVWPSVHPNGGIYEWVRAPWQGIVELDGTYSAFNGLDLSRIDFDAPSYPWDDEEYEEEYYQDPL